MTGCPYHHGLCAYDGTEEDRCAACHKLWAGIGACMSIKACGCRTPEQRQAGQPATREAHLAMHGQAHARRGAGKPDEDGDGTP